ncbi:MAG: putative endo,3-beta-glucanase [Streptosporangiaceae bacterium]|nr:putative endo,3-beta-glucanase [Streptosporangiaceae bacterium]
MREEKLSELKQEDRQRQERVNFADAFNRRVWQPDERPRAASRIVGVSVAVTLVAVGALGIGVMRSYNDKSAAEEKAKAAALRRREAPSSTSTPPGHAPLPYTPLSPGGGGRGGAGPALLTDPRPQDGKGAPAPAPASGGQAGRTSGPGTAPRSEPRIRAAQGSGGRNAYTPIQAESYGQQSGLVREATSDSGGGQNIGAAANGDWALYRGVDFGSTATTQFYARAASGAADGVSGLVEVRLGSRSNSPIGSFAIAGTGGWQSWRTIPANISGVTGVHDVYLTFTSDQSASFVNVNWFDFGH